MGARERGSEGEQGSEKACNLRSVLERGKKEGTEEGRWKEGGGKRASERARKLQVQVEISEARERVSEGGGREGKVRKEERKEHGREGRGGEGRRESERESKRDRERA